MQVEDFRNTYAEVNLKHLCHNFRQLEAMVSENTFFCPMVKANAYGHGDVATVKALKKEGVRFVGVALLEEGIRLRAAGITDLQVLVFGPFGAEGVAVAREYKLTPVVSSLEQLQEIVSGLSLQDSFHCHLKFNTGMNRLGIDVDQLESTQNLLKSKPQIKVSGICTHLAQGEDSLEVGGTTDQQLAQFTKIGQLFPQTIQHVYNSSGLIAQHLRPSSQAFYGARPGIALYGVKPSLVNLSEADLIRWKAIDLKPVMTLRSSLIGLHHLKAGERVSYGGTWTAPCQSIIGVVSIGYADGYHRLVSNRGFLLYRGQRVPIVGRVCMDYLMVDLTSVVGESGVKRSAKIGEEVVLFGEQQGATLGVEELSTWAETISYEILTGISARIPRQWI